MSNKKYKKEPVAFEKVLHSTTIYVGWKNLHGTSINIEQTFYNMKPFQVFSNSQNLIDFMFLIGYQNIIVDMSDFDIFNLRSIISDKMHVM